MLGLVVVAALAAGATAPVGPCFAQPESAHGPVLMKEAADRAYTRARQLGAKLFTTTFAPLSGNGQSCASCHSRSRPLAGVFGRYPRHDRLTGRLVPLDEQIVRCVTNRMAGRSLSPGSAELVALLVHLKETGVRSPRTPSSSPPSRGAATGPAR